MNENTKKYTLIAGLAIALLATIALWRFADAYSKSIQPSSFRSFSAQGEGKVVAIPDVAEFTFSVITEGGRDITALQEDNNTKVNRAINYVKGKGVESKDVTTSQYTVEPRYQYCNSGLNGGTCPPPSIVGYRIAQTVSVKLRDFSKTGEVLSGIVNEGVNSVSQLSFTVDDPIGLQNEARAKAIENAKERASVIARAGNFRIGRLLVIEDGSIPYYPTYARPEMGGAANDALKAATPPVIEAGSQEIKVNVVLRYEID